MSETKEDLYVPSKHLYMDWATAMRRIAALFDVIMEAERETASCLAYLGQNIAEDQLALNEEHWQESEDDQEKHAATPSVLRAHTFELLDSAGKVRARITCNKNNEVIVQDLYANEILRTPLAAKKETN